MSPEDLVARLLAAEGERDRQTLLIPREGDFYVRVATLLKAEVDRERLRNLQAALRVAQIAAEVAGVAAVPRCRALADWARGNVLVHRGDYDQSLRHFQQAADIFAADGCRAEAARLSLNQAVVLSNLGRHSEALPKAQAALDILRPDGPSPLLATMLIGLGAIYRSLSRYDDSLEVYAESEGIFSALGDEVGRARVAINQANVFENLDRFAEALSLLQQARDALAQHECFLEVARADLNLGITYTRLGRYDEALTALDRASDQFEALDNAMEVSVVALYRADLYAEFNLYEELLLAPLGEWRLFEERGMQWQAARATLHKAVAWRRLGNVTRAGELLSEARAGFARIEASVWVRLTDLERVALGCEMGEWAEALPLATETAASLLDAGMPIRAVGASLLAADCHLELGQVEAAKSLYQGVLDTALELDTLPLLYRAHHGLGRAAREQARLPNAYEQFQRAVETVEDLRQRLRVEDFRVGFLEDKLHVYRDAVLLCLQMDRPEEAFTYVERAKSGALVDMLMAHLSRPPSEEEPSDPDLLTHLNALRERLNWHYGELEGSGEEERGGGWLRPEHDVWQQIKTIEQEAVRTWRQLQQTHPFYLSSDHSERSTISTVQACLREGEALVQYYLAGDAIYAFVVDSEGLRSCVRLACTLVQVQDAVSALDTALRSASGFTGEYIATTLIPLSQQILGWLYDDLLRPVLPSLEGVERLLVAPDGVLFEIPFHALYDGQRHVLEDFEVACVPSGAALLLCQENRRRRVKDAAPPLIVGYSRGGELGHVLREVEAVAHVIPDATVLTDQEATAASLQGHAGRSSILHLATHATFRRDNPLFSALQLAGGEWLRAMDLYTLNLSGALVTLSACETGRHRLRGGDLFGLSRGFFCAGASALVASLWPADDASTAILMAQFYTSLSTGEPAVSALRLAQQSLRTLEEERDGHVVRPYAHPFYWAPFCLLGLPDVRLT